MCVLADAHRKLFFFSRVHVFLYIFLDLERYFIQHIIILWRPSHFAKLKRESWKQADKKTRHFYKWLILKRSAERHICSEQNTKIWPSVQCNGCCFCYKCAFLQMVSISLICKRDIFVGLFVSCLFLSFVKIKQSSQDYDLVLMYTTLLKVSKIVVRV